MTDLRQGYVLSYSLPARLFHWATVAIVLCLFASGMWMTYRGEDLKLWDATTNFLYSSHKALGMALLILVVARLGYRLVHGAPGDPPSFTRLQRLAAHTVHWLLYGLLLVVPVLGWVGVSMFPALDVFGFKLPALSGPDREMSKQIFELHELLGDVLLALIGLHLAAALFHHFILRDGVLRRMWPAKRAD